MSNKKIQYNVCRIGYVAMVLLVSFFLISPFIIPIVFAASVALALFPLLVKLERKGLGRNKAAALITFTFAILFSLPIFFFAVKGTMAATSQLQKMSQNENIKNQSVSEIISSFRLQVVEGVRKNAGKVHLEEFLTDERVNSYLTAATNFAFKFFQSFASGLPEIFLFFLMMILCLYSFLARASGVRLFFEKILGLPSNKMDFLITVFIRDSRQIYISNVTTGAIQSLIVALAVVALGLGDFFFVFLVTFVLSFVPVVGAAPVAFAFGAYAFFQDFTASAIILVVVGCFSGVIDNILRPWLASFGESAIPPVVSFVFVIGGALLLGFPGLFLGILVGSIAYDTLPMFWEELAKDSSIK